MSLAIVNTAQTDKSPIALFPKIMHRILEAIREWGLSYPAEEDGENLPAVFVERGYVALIESVLKREPGSILRDLTTAYLERNNFQAIFDLVNRFDRERLPLSNVLEGMLNANAADDEFLRFATCLRKANQNSQIEDTAFALLEKGRKSLAKQIIENYAAENEKEILTLKFRLVQKEKFSLVEAKSAVSSLYAESTKKGEGYEFDHFDRKEKLVIELIALLVDEGEYDSAIELYSIASEIASKATSGKKKLQLGHDSCGKLFFYCLNLEQYENAALVCSAYSRHFGYEEKLAYAKIQNGIRKGDALLAKEGTTLLEKVVDEVLSSKLEDDGDPQKLEYYQRKNYFEKQANKFAQFAIVALCFGEQEQARDSISRMIKATDGLGVIPAECPPHHVSSIKTATYDLKRSLKTIFLLAGHLDKLPVKDGWNTPIKLPANKLQDGAKIARPQEANILEVPRRQRTREEEFAELRQSILKDLKYKPYKDAAVRGIESCAGFPQDYNWYQATCILEVDPSKFHKLREALTRHIFSGNDYYLDMTPHATGLAKFYCMAHRQGVLTEKDWENLYVGIDRSRLGDNGYRQHNGLLIRSFVREFLADNDIATALDFYSTLIRRGNGNLRGESSPVSQSTQHSCLAMLLRALSPYDINYPGIRDSLTGKASPSSDKPQHAVGFFNTSIELLHAQRLSAEESPYERPEARDARLAKDKEILQQIDMNQGRLLQACTTPASVGLLAKLLFAGSGRNQHEVKDLLLAIRESQSSAKIKYRIVSTLIEQRLPGAEGMDEINKQDTPGEYVKFFFRKLVEKGMLHKHTLQYLGDNDAYLPFIKRLIAQYPNQFNTAMETLETSLNPQSREGQAESHEAKSGSLPKLDLKEWGNFLRVIQTLGVITPGIFREVRARKYSREALVEIKERLKSLKDNLFSSDKIETELSPEIMAEVIYAAYRPANMSLFRMMEICKVLQDCSGHLDRFKFSRSGYALQMAPVSTMRLRNKREQIESLSMASALDNAVQAANVSSPEFIQITARRLCSLARFKETEEVSLADSLSFLFTESFFVEAISQVLLTNSDNDKFKSLRYLEEVLGVYLSDNAEEKIKVFFESNTEYISKMLAALASNLRTSKWQKIYLDQCQVRLDPELSDAALVARAASSVILQKLKSLKLAKREIRSDLTKFVADTGEGVQAEIPRLRAIISKNQASFFAKASAGICTDTDISLFMREDHFHINIIDEAKQICIGNIQAYIMDYQGRPFLLLRGFNPSVNLLKEVDAKSFCTAILDIGREFARENNLGGVILSEQGKFFALSNRAEVATYLIKEFEKQAIEFPAFQIVSRSTISKGYLLVNFNETSGDPKN